MKPRYQVRLTRVTDSITIVHLLKTSAKASQYCSTQTQVGPIMGQTFFGFVKLCLVSLWVHWCIISIFLGLLMRKFDKVSARLSFLPKYFRAVAENAMKPLIFMYHETMSIFLGSKMS